MKKTTMKKITLILFFLTTVSTFFAQTIVSTSPQNKKVILEEFTGVNCVYCPQGHAIANAMKTANPDNVFLINVHVGGYATPSAGQPDFRTPFGTAIAGQTGLQGYPAGTINRQVFPTAMTAGGTAMGRGDWTTAANQVLTESSYVNVGVTSSIDAITRILTVNVEAYYTGNSPVATNKLNVAFLQNNTLGAQTGGNLGNNYNHQHRLIHMITGQWGEDITTTTSGSLVTKTYTYTIPASYNLIPAVIGDFEVVAFVADGNQNIQSGAESTPTYLGLTPNEIQFKKVEPIIAQCASTGSISPKITIRNNGQNALTSLAVDYSVNSGTTQTYNWTGNLATFNNQTITLDPIPYSILTTNTINVSLPSDDLNTNNTGSGTFTKAVDTQYSNITIKITLDPYGSETSWALKNSADVVVAQSPVYADAPTTTGTYPQPDINLTLPLDCYSFVVSDTYGDGMSPGTFKVFANGVQIPGISGGVFTNTIAKSFGVIQNLSTSDFSKNKLSLYPNPSNGFLKIQTELPVNVTLIDVLGKVVFTANNITSQNEIDITTLQKGLYLAKISGENINLTERIILN
jgi:hypothetical protein